MKAKPPSTDPATRAEADGGALCGCGSVAVYTHIGVRVFVRFCAECCVDIFGCVPTPDVYARARKRKHRKRAA